MHAPPSSHFIYIPFVLILGLVIGFVLGARASRDAMTVERRRQADRDARRAARQAREASTSGSDRPAGDPPQGA